MATAARPVVAAPPRQSAAAGLQVSRLVVAHIWVAIAAFAVACLLGVWQMWARSPIPAPAHTAARVGGRGALDRSMVRRYSGIAVVPLSRAPVKSRGATAACRAALE